MFSVFLNRGRQQRFVQFRQVVYRHASPVSSEASSA
jgi:hypothetical protein